MESGSAPGKPGIAPTWCSSAKDMVLTALGPSRIWVTLGYGIINEVYYPSTGEPQIRDLGFIVANEGGWFEVKRVNRYTLALPEPYIPLPTVTHQGEGYELTLELVTDPIREVLLVRYTIRGNGFKLYPLLAPHLGPKSQENAAWIDREILHARGGEAHLCLLSDNGFRRASAGFVGFSDGWQDFSKNGRMTWTYERAEVGNVALLGELEAPSGLLALGFASSAEGARTLARSSLAEGFDASSAGFVKAWKTWGTRLRIPETTAEIRREALLSATVLKVHEDKSYPGAVTASLSIPWGASRDDLGGYHLVWARDAVEAGLGLLAVGQVEDARRMLSYLVGTQGPDGSWPQNFYPDGTPFWTGVQLDEIGFPVLLAAKLGDLRPRAELLGLRTMVRRALSYLARHGPISPQDRWEESAGVNPFTLAVEIVALVAGSAFLSEPDKSYALSLADYWNERIESWTYAVRGAWAEGAGVEGYYVRIAPPPDRGGLRGRVELRNRRDVTVGADELIGLEFLYLSRLGLRAPTDPKIEATLKVAEMVLQVGTPSGLSYHRYNGDGYGEHEDGGPFDGTGIGRAWPLLTGERGHHAAARGEDPTPYLEAMTRMTGPGGLIPEQVWDTTAIPQRGLSPGRPSGSAMPLVWAHAEFLKLVTALMNGEPFDRLKAIQARYGGVRPDADTWHWRLDTPFDALPRGKNLVIENTAPFLLRLREDRHEETRDVPAESLGLEMYGVRLAADWLGALGEIGFKLLPLENHGEGDVEHSLRLSVEGGQD
ncbi:MAG TPA: glycoside hydrolase family 15 protein [Candidatus Binatia bacterium]|nr:glycoside hydrolase family 15 protein [Candidatus Binatia bacterium]